MYKKNENQINEIVFHKSFLKKNPKMYKKNENRTYQILAYKKSLKIYTHTHICTHLCEFVDNTCFQSEQQIHKIYLKQRSIIFCLKPDHHINQV